jgi:hypothetical protein
VNPHRAAFVRPVGIIRDMDYSFDAPLWRWEGEAAWHFVSLPEDVADEIEDSPAQRGGFGSVRVQVRVGSSTWSTSLFPDTKRGTFLLPMKKQVRDRERLTEGDLVAVRLRILD